VLGGDPLLDAPIDVVECGRRRRVQLALARLRLFALGSPTSRAIKRVLGLLGRDPELGIDAISVVEHYSLQVINYRHDWWLS
jgi:hypothetical protein